jgi:hypothetical protein
MPRLASALALLLASLAVLFPEAAAPSRPPTANAHMLQMEIQFAMVDPSYQQVFESRLTARQPLIQAGDVITLVFGGLPTVRTNDGLGGYFDF